MKWCIKIDDKNYSILHKWKEEQPGVNKEYESMSWLLSEPGLDMSYLNYDNSQVPGSFKQITLEQFLQEVLKQSNTYEIY